MRLKHGSFSSSRSRPGRSTCGGGGGNQQAVGMYNLGLTAYKQGSLESAVIFFRHATDLDPNLTDAQYNLGVLYQSERRLKEAVPRFPEVLRVKPADPDAHYQLGIALMDLGRHAEAKQQFAAIAPASAHFADAQKRTATCDQVLSGATVAQPSYSPSATPQGQPPAASAGSQAMNLNPIAQNESSAPNPYQQAQQYQQQQQAQAPQTMPQAQPQVQTQVAVQPTTPQGANVFKAPAPPQARHHARCWPIARYALSPPASMLPPVLPLTVWAISM